MDRADVHDLLIRVSRGEESVEVALSHLTTGPLTPGLATDPDRADGFVDLGFARVDTHRGMRTGDPEVVYGAGKGPRELVPIVEALRAASSTRPVLVTRLSHDGEVELRAAIPGITVDEPSRCALVGEPPKPMGRVAVLSAGTSDGPVAAEAAFVARAMGAVAVRYNDVGVAGIHRLLAVAPELDAYDCLVVVAGMEGALPSVVGGLAGVPLVAVPTSVGYGSSFAGLTALLAMLNSCAPGVVVSNIDNGFGAGAFAARVARRSASQAPAAGAVR
ncbi:nickel pincer cofactor biosynthesis protein LarB [Streptomyces cellostaticus]|uniref:nickel pincer cofactor biosynthesis protein LarB n=1 Tax=Streptomyces cellostaticus TaxID=67285 RepID=UPI002026CD3C|nr:nickel pincer cofactor biosynthesis protein LarB [Streptomyces cellostaticus]